MKEYYVIETKNMRGYTINGEKLECISLYEYYKKELFEKHNPTTENEKDKIIFGIPTFLILKKLGKEFFESLTNTQVTSEEDYKKGEGLFYVNKNYGFGTNKPLSLADKSFDEYSKDWQFNFEENLDILNSFINLTRLYSSTSEEFITNKAKKLEFYDSVMEEELNAINNFENNVKNSVKTR